MSKTVVRNKRDCRRKSGSGNAKKLMFYRILNTAGLCSLKRERRRNASVLTVIVSKDESDVIHIVARARWAVSRRLPSSQLRTYIYIFVKLQSLFKMSALPCVLWDWVMFFCDLNKYLSVFCRVSSVDTLLEWLVTNCVWIFRRIQGLTETLCFHCPIKHYNFRTLSTLGNFRTLLSKLVHQTTIFNNNTKF